MNNKGTVSSGVTAPAPKGTPTTVVNNTTYSTKNKVLVKEENNLCVAYREVPAEDLEFEWKGSKIPFSVWCEIMAFHRFSEIKYSGNETQGRMFYNSETGEWFNVIYPQTGISLSTKELESGPVIDEIRKQYAYPWRCIGTHHNHCHTSAFQSGTDHRDEIDQAGLHITLGYLDKDTFNFHGRFTMFNRNNPVTKISEWVDVEGAEFSDEVVAALEVLKLKAKLKITLADAGNISMPNSWNKMSEAEWFQYLIKEGCDVSALWEQILLTINPDLTKYEELTKKWESLITITPRVASGRVYTGPYSPVGPNNSNSASTRQSTTVGNSVKSSKTVESEVMNAAYNVTMFTPYLPSENYKAALRAVWPACIAAQYDFALLEYLCQIPENAATALSATEKGLWNRMQNIVNSGHCPLDMLGLADLFTIMEAIVTHGITK